MSTSEPERTANVPPGPIDPPPGPTSAGAVPHRRPPWLSALAAGVIAAGLTWGAGEAAAGRFDPGTVADPSRGPLAGGVSVEAVNRALVNEAVLTYGLQGAILGLLLGLAGAAAGGSARAAMAGGLTGLVLGGAAGAGASLGAFTVFVQAVDPSSNDLVGPIIAHAVAWGLLGAAAGLAFGVGSRGGKAGIVRAAIGGLVGAAIGAAVYEVAGAVFFASDQTSQPVAVSGSARLLAHAATDVLIALGAALAISSPRKTGLG
jgi:hypothetical protein